MGSYKELAKAVLEIELQTERSKHELRQIRNKYIKQIHKLKDDTIAEVHQILRGKE